MKILKKRDMRVMQQKVHASTERKILENMNSPFIVQLHYAFQTANKLYLVLDFMQGGELFYHMRQSFVFNLERTRFYAAEIVLALEFLHKQGIIYRDLKPENVLLDRDGHIRIADFGLSKQGIHAGLQTFTFCGTPEYICPEILKGVGHDKSVDWWSLGAIIYEMLTGAPPHYSKVRKRMYYNIINVRTQTATPIKLCRNKSR